MFLEPRDFIGLFIMGVILIIPLGSIYLTLKTLKWNEGKGLFSISWALFFVWIISSLLSVFICAAAADNLRFFQNKTFFILLIPSTLIVNTVSIAGILSLINDNRERKLVLIEGRDSKENHQIGYKKIFQTSAVVSIITLAVVTSLIFFLIDIDSKMKIPNPPNGGIFID